VYRFTQPDTIIPEFTNPQSWNKYSYVENRPIIFNDPTGQTSACGFVYSDPDCPEEDDSNPPPLSVPSIPLDSTSDEDASHIPQLPCRSLYGVTADEYVTACNNLNQAVHILYHPNANISQKIGASYYVSVFTVSHVAVLGGTVWAAWEAIIPTSISCAESPSCSQGVSNGFSSFQSLKNTIGSPGPGNVWHHIVEQAQIRRSGFSPQQVHNITNILSVSQSIHYRISGYYSSIRPFTDGMTVRNWLTAQSFEEQFIFGVKVLQDFVILK
jgi:hypothetical protein